jgi:3-mercaptopyruvate sulfurtransferase SseA
MRLWAATLAMLSLSLFGCRQVHALDEDPANWTRVSIPVGEQVLTFGVPHGHRFERHNPPPNVTNLEDRQLFSRVEAEKCPYALQ